MVPGFIHLRQRAVLQRSRVKARRICPAVAITIAATMIGTGGHNRCFRHGLRSSSQPGQEAPWHFANPLSCIQLPPEHQLLGQLQTAATLRLLIPPVRLLNRPRQTLEKCPQATLARNCPVAPSNCPVTFLRRQIACSLTALG